MWPHWPHVASAVKAIGLRTGSINTWPGISLLGQAALPGRGLAVHFPGRLQDRWQGGVCWVRREPGASPSPLSRARSRGPPPRSSSSHSSNSQVARVLRLCLGNDVMSDVRSCDHSCDHRCDWTAQATANTAFYCYLSAASLAISCVIIRVIPQALRWPPGV
jgi:hypothetical protein